METLWGKLTKREKELNMSKVGARDLSHAVKSMKTALEQSRQDSKAMKEEMASLQVRGTWGGNFAGHNSSAYYGVLILHIYSIIFALFFSPSP